MRDLSANEPPGRAAGVKAQEERLSRAREHRRVNAREAQLSDVARRMSLVVPALAARLMRKPVCDETALLLDAAISFERAARRGRTW